MSFGFDNIQIYVIKIKDGGALMEIFDRHNFTCHYSGKSGEYYFYDEIEYNAALIMI